MIHRCPPFSPLLRIHALIPPDVRIYIGLPHLGRYALSIPAANPRPSVSGEDFILARNPPRRLSPAPAKFPAKRLAIANKFLRRLCDQLRHSQIRQHTRPKRPTMVPPKASPQEPPSKTNPCSLCDRCMESDQPKIYPFIKFEILRLGFHSGKTHSAPHRPRLQQRPRSSGRPIRPLSTSDAILHFPQYPTPKSMSRYSPAQIVQRTKRDKSILNRRQRIHRLIRCIHRRWFKTPITTRQPNRPLAIQLIISPADREPDQSNDNQSPQSARPEKPQTSPAPAFGLRKNRQTIRHSVHRQINQNINPIPRKPPGPPDHRRAPQSAANDRRRL